jgi:hypothetical protein
LPGDFGDTGTLAIRKGSYKLVGEELYNVVDDPYETRDVAAAKPEIYQVLHQRLTDLIEERRTPEVHTNISQTINQPLLVFGKEENASPPDWLAAYLKALPPTKKEQQRAAGKK